ncbi:MAG: hypothetical protein HRT68_14895 [Flavobacteriaceae bacterium]|nr:hypothetical protein [Flavobacteriaceae bacterium]
MAKKPDGIISIQQAQDYFNNYRNDNKKRMKKNQQSIFGWHSLDTIKEYIEFIEEEAIKAGVEVSGISLYFGADKPINGSKKGQLTYFFAPTYHDDGTGRHEAFDTFSSTDEKPNKIHVSIVEGEKNRSFSSNKSLLLNDSRLCPPICN